PSTFFSFSLLPPPPTSTLFPYTTLFRSPCNRRDRTVAAPGIFSRTRGQKVVPRQRKVERVPSCRRPVGSPSCGDEWRQRERFSRSEEHTSELQSLTNLVCRLLLEKKNPT